MTDEEREAALKKLAEVTEAFQPFIDSVTKAFWALSLWAIENKEVFEKVVEELEKLEKEGEKCNQYH